MQLLQKVCNYFQIKVAQFQIFKNRVVVHNIILIYVFIEFSLPKIVVLFCFAKSILCCTAEVSFLYLQCYAYKLKLNHICILREPIKSRESQSNYLIGKSIDYYRLIVFN